MALKFKYQAKDEKGFPSPPQVRCPKLVGRFAARGPAEQVSLYAEREGATGKS
jgi:hypothetical protein